MNSTFCQCPTLTELVEFKLNENFVFVQNLMLSWIALASTYIATYIAMFKIFAHKTFQQTYQIARQYKHEIQKYNLTAVQDLTERAKDLTERVRDVYENIPVISYEVQAIVVLSCFVIYLIFKIRNLLVKLNKARNAETLRDLCKNIECEECVRVVEDSRDDAPVADNDDDEISESESESEPEDDKDPEYISDSEDSDEDELDRIEEERIKKRMYKKKKPVAPVKPIKKRANPVSRFDPLAEPEFVLNQATGRYIKKIVA